MSSSRRVPGRRWVRRIVTSLVLAMGWPGSGVATTPDPALLAGDCAGCHGRTGVSAGPASPSFAGFDRRYLIRILQEFRNDERPATIMGRIMRGYTATEIRRISDHYAAQEWGAAEVEVDPTAVERGRRLHEEVCEECHERGGRHQDRDTPRLAGQWPEYLVLQLEGFRDRPTLAPQPSKMRDALVGVSDGDLAALAIFYAEQR